LRSLRDRLSGTMAAILREPDGKEWLQVNEYEGILWFRREAFEELSGGLLAAALFPRARFWQTSDRTLERLDEARQIFSRVAEQSDYQVSRLLEGISRLGSPKTAAGRKRSRSGS